MIDLDQAGAPAADEIESWLKENVRLNLRDVAGSLAARATMLRVACSGAPACAGDTNGTPRIQEEVWHCRCRCRCLLCGASGRRWAVSVGDHEPWRAAHEALRTESPRSPTGNGARLRSSAQAKGLDSVEPRRAFSFIYIKFFDSLSAPLRTCLIIAASCPMRGRF